MISPTLTADEQLRTDRVHRFTTAQRLHGKHIDADEDKRHGEMGTEMIVLTMRLFCELYRF